MSCFNDLKTKISNKEAVVTVIGMGYVGLPLAIELSKSKFVTYGYDLDEHKINKLKQGVSYIQDIDSDVLNSCLNSNNFIPTSDKSCLRDSDIISICVPTPLTKNQQPDISYIVSAVDQIIESFNGKKLIILESTTYPGTTEELILYRLQDMGYEVGEDFFLCFSPERVDPGNKHFTTHNTPKVVGGFTKKCNDLGREFYGSIIENIILVSNPRVAEMTKLMENTFRSINISFINEMAIMCDKLGIDVWEVIDAAKTKPFGFMPFYPGPGIGGHCIPLDPMYLAWKAKGHNFYSRFIELAQDINKNMPNYVLQSLMVALNKIGKPIRNSNILILGMAYKPDIDDLRESPSLEVYELLKHSGANVSYNDPYVESFRDSSGATVNSTTLDINEIRQYDCVILLTDHSIYNYEEIVFNSNLIFDTRNGLKNIIDSPKVIKLGGGNLF